MKISTNLSKNTRKSNISVTSSQKKLLTTKNLIKSSKFETVTNSNNVITNSVQNSFTTSYNKNTKNLKTSNSNNLYIYIIIGISSIIVIGIFIKLLRR